MDDNNEVKRLSKAAIAEYRAKLDELKNVTRLEIAQQIKEARAFGDISENAEYDAAMDNQARIEYEIVQLEELLANVEEIDEANVDISSVNVGGRVRVRCKSDDMVEEYDIVSTSEVEPFIRKVTIECSDDDLNKRLGYKKGQTVSLTSPAKLSNESPLGRSLLGHRKGDQVEVYSPRGVLSYVIEDIIKVPDMPHGKLISEEIIG